MRIIRQVEAPEHRARHACRRHLHAHDALVARSLRRLRRIVRQAQRRGRTRGEQRGAVVHWNDRIQRVLTRVLDDGAGRGLNIAEVGLERRAPLVSNLSGQVQSAHDLDIQRARRLRERLRAICAGRDEQQQSLARDGGRRFVGREGLRR
jgi:hypothetical protein